MVKKVVVFVVLLFLFLVPLTAQDLSTIRSDVSSMIEGISDDMLPHFHHATAAVDGFGPAAMAGEKTWYLGFTLGSTFYPGVFTFVDKENSQFDLLNVYNLVDSLPTAVTSIHKTFSEFFPYPAIRLVGGTKLPADFFLTVHSSYWPQLFSDLLADAFSVEGLRFSSINAGFRLQKVLIEESGAMPSLALGGGYTFAYLDAGFAIPEYTQNISGTDLVLSGNLYSTLMIHSAGLDLTVSKEFGAFVPFLRTLAWYRYSSFTGGIEDYVATISSTDNEDIKVERAVYNVPVIFVAGTDFDFGGYALELAGTFDTSELVFG
ncbi:MAG: hypothetical protein K9L68_04375, partial [Spirochaetales bacterium]|nr:hypothetical protein [Spirochaetales bacterium]MCF7937813.1 hypothetical protein [Spirochaetales bacterium]